MSLRLYHTADLHDRRGIATRLRALRAKRPGLLLDAGDALRGSQSIYRRDEPIGRELDEAGYDAQTIGNREFHYVRAFLAARARAMRRPLLCANLVRASGGAVPFAPSIDLVTPDDQGGPPWRVRVFGLLVVQYPERSPWERLFDWRFLDPVAVAARIAAATPRETVLVALTHLGLPADRLLARAVPRLDCILGGHSHDATPDAEIVAGVPIVHAGPYGACVSRTELARDGERMRVADARLLPLRARAALPG